MRFGPDDEERAGRRKAVQAGEIEGAAIHHVEGMRFERERVEDVQVVQFALVINTR